MSESGTGLTLSGALHWRRERTFIWFAQHYSLTLSGPLRGAAFHNAPFNELRGTCVVGLSRPKLWHYQAF
jgi:hypothetical protein